MTTFTSIPGEANNLGDGELLVRRDRTRPLKGQLRFVA